MFLLHAKGGSRAPTSELIALSTEPKQDRLGSAKSKLREQTERLQCSVAFPCRRSGQLDAYLRPSFGQLRKLEYKKSDFSQITLPFPSEDPLEMGAAAKTPPGSLKLLPPSLPESTKRILSVRTFGIIEGL